MEHLKAVAMGSTKGRRKDEPKVTKRVVRRVRPTATTKESRRVKSTEMLMKQRMGQQMVCRKVHAKESRMVALMARSMVHSTDQQMVC